MFTKSKQKLIFFGRMASLIIMVFLDQQGLLTIGNVVHLEMYVGRGGCPCGGTTATPGSGLAHQAPNGGERCSEPGEGRGCSGPGEVH